MKDNVVQVVGKQVLDFENRETGEQVKGVNLFINTPDDHVFGLKAVKQFIGVKSAAYNQAFNLDLSAGSLNCIFKYDYRVGQKHPVLTSIEVV